MARGEKAGPTEKGRGESMSIKILDEIISCVREDAPIRDVRIGPFWTAVQTRGCGLASTTFVHEHN
jgi:uncharacterized protein (DUF4213/DUF364 family)